ncbi:hypothetical protein DID76_02920 [Candidatus Marinamargulisbacteria bacterium SCGC AG-414-C22]|nr:hypothetical protein DID76_02920 [Candidatus Marinamargulisbacteria bacterium SCGC AG-414-C22]
MNKNLKSSLLILFFVVATELIGFGLIIPVLPVLASQYEINHFLLGILMGSFSFAQFIAAPFLGSLSDKVGRKPVLILSKLGTVIAYVVLAYSQHYWMFLFARLLDGFTGGNIAVARAYVADITDKKTRPKGMAIIGISFGVGFILGPILGGILYQQFEGQFVASLVAGGLSLCALIVTVFYLKEPEKHQETKSFCVNLKEGMQQIKTLPVGLICCTYLLYMILFSGFETTFSMFLQFIFSFTAHQISWVFVFTGLVGLIVQGYISRRATQFFERFVVVGLGILAISFIGLSLSNTFLLLFICLALFATSISLVIIFMPSLLTCYVKDQHTGGVMGVYEGLGSLGRVLGPVLAYSFPLQFIRQQYFFYGIILCLLAVIFSYLFYARKLVQSQVS